MPDSVTALSLLAKLVLYGGALPAAGAALFEAVLGDAAGRLRRPILLSVLIGAPIAALAVAALFGLQAAILAGGGLGGFADPEMAQLLWETQAGSALLLIVSGLAVLAASRLLSGAFRAAAGLVGAVAVAGSFTLVGHANDGPSGVMHALIGAHLLAASFWIGALWPLKAAAEGAVPLATAAALADRFGRIAAWIVPGLIAAGAATAIFLLRSVEAALVSDYGRVLLAKLAFVATLLGLAALNKLRLTPRMLRGERAAAGALSRSIAIEMVAIGAILAATALLTSVASLPS